MFTRKQRYPSRPNISRYKQIQSQIQKKTRREYWAYINGILYPEDNKEEKDNNKKFWTYLKHCKNDSVGVAPLRDTSTGMMATDPKMKAELANRQFQSAFSLKSPLKLAQLCKQTIWNRPPDSIPEDVRRKYPSMPDFTIGVNGIKKLLGALKPHKAAGPDKLKPLALKELRDSLAPILQVIFTKSLSSGKLPRDWKSANVVPIYKKERDTSA